MVSKSLKSMRFRVRGGGVGWGVAAPTLPLSARWSGRPTGSRAAPRGTPAGERRHGETDDEQRGLHGASARDRRGPGPAAQGGRPTCRRARGGHRWRRHDRSHRTPPTPATWRHARRALSAASTGRHAAPTGGRAAEEDRCPRRRGPVPRHRALRMRRCHPDRGRLTVPRRARRVGSPSHAPESLRVAVSPTRRDRAVEHTPAATGADSSGCTMRGRLDGPGGPYARRPATCRISATASAGGSRSTRQ